MASDEGAGGYIAHMNKEMQPLATAVHEIFEGHGCTSYVKTIYIGYDLDGEMVAAMYGHTSSVEVALALSEDATGPLLTDASHLTWRTLPVAAVIAKKSDIDVFATNAAEAVDRVRRSALRSRTGQRIFRSVETRASGSLARPDALPSTPFAAPSDERAMRRACDRPAATGAR